MKKIAVFLSLVLMLSGCSSTGPVFQQITLTPPDKSTVYIYRPHQGFNMAGWPEIFIDGKKEFALKNEGYGVVHLSPGEHKIKAEGSVIFTNWYPGPMEITKTFEANKEYFIRVTPKMTSAMVVGSSMTMTGKANVSVVTESKALSEIAETKKVH
ncbi:DUF2846 domain-containing protein [Neptunomonas japonica]|uniref:DUF2846 domain-containing protein n=1 Tax=Neptunomonas japonica JAMM 1380 TaxID=1441457 RepID=A0A7R6SVH0_9GAMM|nr:DUF2846 domain-containing protein [Neptunomonas japonica]BBB29386.1 conserved hypothetical protein [Neptunomonas japonica JAMM 1380]